MIESVRMHLSWAKTLGYKYTGQEVIIPFRIRIVNSYYMDLYSNELEKARYIMF